MTKEEKIKESYLIELSENLIDKKKGLDFFKNLEPYINVDGWIDSEKDNGFGGYLMESNLEIKFPLLRLKSLQGIENNNGWIKIESENDLPTNTEVYHHGIMNGEVICFKLQHPLNLKRLYNDFQKDKVTHYQEILKPKPPIY